MIFDGPMYYILGLALRLFMKFGLVGLNGLTSLIGVIGVISLSGVYV